jgi:hypothetical protein
MLNIVDPGELKPAEIYSQARTVASKTSRSRHVDWYRTPEELNCQWHLWFDGGREIVSATFSRSENRWRTGPELPLSKLTTGEGVKELLGEFFSTKFFDSKPKSLGVILHVADEFGLSEVVDLGEGSAEGGDDFGLLRYNLIDEPLEVLADRDVSPDTTSWRLLPFWGALPGQSRCAAVALSRARESFLKTLMDCGEDLRMPIRVAVASAPVEALAGLPLARPDLTGGCLVVMPYFKLTVVFALSAGGELRVARSLSHRGGGMVPAGFGDILWNMAVGAELAGGEHGGKPKILLVSANKKALQAAAEDLEMFSLSRQSLECESLDLTSLPALNEVPGHLLEFLSYDPAALEKARAGVGPLPASETFGSLWQGWAHQNYMDIARLDALYPTRSDLNLLRLSRGLLTLLVLALIATGGYGTWSLMAAMKHPSWHLTPDEVQQAKARNTLLLNEQKQIHLVEKLMLPRSRGWMAMEFLMQIFPEDSGVRVDSYNYVLDTARAARAASRGKAPEPEFCGLSRSWQIKGLVKPKAMELLSGINSQRGVSAFFEKLAEVTGDESYRPNQDRSLTVTLTQGRNSRYDPQAGADDLARDPVMAYPFNFEITISQTLSDKDPWALPLAKPSGT